MSKVEMTPALADSMVEALTDAGYVVVIWTPDEAKEVDAGSLAEIAYRAGNEFIHPPVPHSPVSH